MSAFHYVKKTFSLLTSRFGSYCLLNLKQLGILLALGVMAIGALNAGNEILILVLLVAFVLLMWLAIGLFLALPTQWAEHEAGEVSVFGFFNKQGFSKVSNITLVLFLPMIFNFPVSFIEKYLPDGKADLFVFLFALTGFYFTLRLASLISIIVRNEKVLFKDFWTLSKGKAWMSFKLVLLSFLFTALIFAGVGITAFVLFKILTKTVSFDAYVHDFLHMTPLGFDVASAFTNYKEFMALLTENGLMSSFLVRFGLFALVALVLSYVFFMFAMLCSNLYYAALSLYTKDCEQDSEQKNEA